MPQFASQTPTSMPQFASQTQTTSQIEQQGFSPSVSLMNAMQTPPGHVNAGTPTVSFNIQSIKCCVCYERERKSFLIPCGHQYCMVCAVQLEANGGVCALCRASISSVGKLQDC